MSRLPVTTTSDDNLLRSIFASSGLHIVILLFIFFGLPHFLKPLPAPSIPIPIEIVDVADITNTRIKEQQEAPKPPEVQPKPEPPKPITAYQPPTPPTPPQPPQPERSKPQEQPQAEALLPKPQEKPKLPPKPVEKPPQTDQLASVLKDLKNLKPAEKAPQQPDTKSQIKTPTQPKSMAPSLSDRLTISEEDLFKRQIEDHWNVPIGARGIETMSVDVVIQVNSDRSVQSVEVVDKARMATDSYFRALAESVVRAIYQSSPLEVPQDKYDQWKVITATFSPKDML